MSSGDVFVHWESTKNTAGKLYICEAERAFFGVCD